MVLHRGEVQQRRPIIPLSIQCFGEGFRRVAWATELRSHHPQRVQRLYVRRINLQRFVKTFFCGSKITRPHLRCAEFHEPLDDIRSAHRECRELSLRQIWFVLLQPDAAEVESRFEQFAIEPQCL